MNKFTLITGGASGLGLDLSRLFANDGHNLFLVSSNIKNLEAAKKEIEEKYKVQVEILATDLTEPSNFKKVKEYTDAHEMDIDILINCAGFGDRCDFKDMDIDKQIKMVELNCNCPMYLMNVYLQGMLKNNEGHIINIASIASFFPGPYMTTYHASKAFLLNISEAVERELKGTNVHLTTICPGPFESNFVSKAHNDYTFKKIKPLPSSKVADITFSAYKKKKSLIIIGTKNKFLIFATRFAPRKFVTAGSAKNLKENV